jgi:hypothetical protein
MSVTMGAALAVDRPPLALGRCASPCQTQSHQRRRRVSSVVGVPGRSQKAAESRVRWRVVDPQVYRFVRLFTNVLDALPANARGTSDISPPWHDGHPQNRHSAPALRLVITPCRAGLEHIRGQSSCFALCVAHADWGCGAAICK